MSGACLESMASSKPTVLHQAVAAGAPQPSPQVTHQSRRSPPNAGLSNVLVSAPASLDEKQSATTAAMTQTSLRIKNLRCLGRTPLLELIAEANVFNGQRRGWQISGDKQVRSNNKPTATQRSLRKPEPGKYRHREMSRDLLDHREP